MRFRMAALSLALGLFAATSCSVFRTIFPSAGPPPRPFNHAAHLGRGLDCLTCHDGGEKGVKAGMPSVDLCMSCHGDIDNAPERPSESKVAWFLDKSGAPKWSAFTRQSEEVRFSHAAHAAGKVGCAQCHVGIDENTGLVPGLFQRMASCTSCHAKEAPTRNECATRHSRIGRDRAPASHDAMWGALHGRCARQGAAAATANDCAMCHREDSCTTCHQTEAPRDHHGTWRFRPHGIAAGLDRTRCATCHSSDSCDRCHQETSPRSHGAGWNAPRSGHCVSCHVPAQSSPNCFVCHKTTPGHDLAPPKPAWHTVVMDCRSCHAASLTHPDNGDNCNACHR